MICREGERGEWEGGEERGEGECLGEEKVEGGKGRDNMELVGAKKMEMRRSDAIGILTIYTNMCT